MLYNVPCVKAEKQPLQRACAQVDEHAHAELEHCRNLLLRTLQHVLARVPHLPASHVPLCFEFFCSYSGPMEVALETA